MAMLGVATLVAAAAVVAGASSASAHTGDLLASAVCNTSTGQYDVTYTLKISNTNLVGTTMWKVGNTTFEGTPTSNHGLTRGPVTSRGTSTITLGTDSIPGTSKEGPWVYAFTTWSDGFTKGSDGRVDVLAGTCHAPVARTAVTAPTFTPPTCTAPGSVSTPASSTYTWARSTGKDGSLTVRAIATKGVTLTGKTSWTYSAAQLAQLTGAACHAAAVTPAAPTFTPPTCTAPGSVSTPASSTYAWSRSTGKDGSLTVRATATKGVTLTGKTSWTYSAAQLAQLTGAVCNGAAVTPAAPTLTPPTCTAPGSVSTPASSTYAWSRSTGKDGSLTVRATATPGVTLTGKTSWTYSAAQLAQLPADGAACTQVQGVKHTAPAAPSAAPVVSPAVTPVVQGVKHEATAVLPRTGSASGLYGVAGLLLVMAGAALVLVTRKRGITG